MEYTLGKFKATDVFTMATLLSKIGLGKASASFGKDNVIKLLSETKGKEDKVTATGIEIALQIGEIILGNLDKCETEVFKLLSSVSGLTIEEIRDMDAEIFAGLIVDVVKLPQFGDFIRVASRLFNSEK